MVLSDEVRDEFTEHSAVVDHKRSGGYLKLKVKGFGNATLFSKIEDTDGVSLGNVSFWGDAPWDKLKVNVRIL